MTFWCRSGSADPCLWLLDPDPDPAFFVIDLQVFLLFEGTFTSFFKDKKSKNVTKQERIKVFLTIFDDRSIQEAQKHTDPDSDPLHCLPFTIVIPWQQVGFQWCGHGHSSARLRRARGSQSQLTRTFGQAVQPELMFSQCVSSKSHLSNIHVQNYYRRIENLNVPRVFICRHFHWDDSD
jgi:hypothetical protein